jgi:hypothetical protein
MNHKATRLLIVVTALIAAAGAAWFLTSKELRDFRVRELEPLAALLKEDQELLQALQTDAAPDKTSGILGSYLARIRADGVSKHAEMKQRLDRLAENNSAIVALVNVYAPHAKTAAFRTEADKFRHSATVWRDRWNSVMEIFMAGGNYPFAEAPFPQAFIGAVQAEIEAARKAF